MGRGHGATRGSGPAAGFGIGVSGRNFAAIPGLQSISDAEIRAELINAMTDYDREFGVRETNIVLDRLGEDVGGEARTSGGKSSEIALNKELFGMSRAQLKGKLAEAENSGLLSKTSNPVRHILAHELGHATWSPEHFTRGEGYRTKQLKNQVVGAYRKFLNDKGASGWGSYARSSYGEFFAEAVAKHMYGSRDRHTEAVVNIIRNNSL